MTHSKTKLALPLVILLHAGTGVADESHTHAPLDLRMPDLSSPLLTLADRAEPEEIAVLGAGSPEDKDVTSSFHWSRTGVGSFYWAARHPRQGWRIILPAVSDQPLILVEDLRVERALFAEQFPRAL